MSVWYKCQKRGGNFQVEVMCCMYLVLLSMVYVQCPCNYSLFFSWCRTRSMREWVANREGMGYIMAVQKSDTLPAGGCTCGGA